MESKRNTGERKIFPGHTKIALTQSRTPATTSSQMQATTTSYGPKTASHDVARVQQTPAILGMSVINPNRINTIRPHKKNSNGGAGRKTRRS
jgi:hypothetical protein